MAQNNPMSQEEFDYITDKLIEDIIQFREFAKVKPITCDPVSLVEAAELCNVSVSGNVVSNLLALQKEKDKMEETDILKKYFWVFIIMGFMVILILGAKIIG